MASRSEPELLKLLNSRSSWNLPPHREPVMTGEFARRAHQAVDTYVRANPSDPYAHDRMSLHIKRGLELPSDVLEESNSRLRAQR